MEFFDFPVAVFIVLEWCALRPIFATTLDAFWGRPGVGKNDEQFILPGSRSHPYMLESEGGERVRDYIFFHALEDASSQ